MNNPNESVVYLLLSSETNDNRELNMNEAKDYLNNLALAIRNHAQILQVKLQEKLLTKSLIEDNKLVSEGEKLEEKRISISATNNQEGNSRDKSLDRKKLKTINKSIKTKVILSNQDIIFLSKKPRLCF